MERSKEKMQQMCLVALFAALIAICSWISVPTTVPFTMQTFAVCMAAGLLGAKLGFVTVFVYLLLGAVGLPVLAGFSGGLGAMLGPTGGYLVGFLFTALVVGGFTAVFGRSVPSLSLAMVLGIVVCYAFGTVWFVFVYRQTSDPIGWMQALVWCVLPYILPDCCKVALAVLLVKRLERFALVQKQAEER